MGYSTGAGAGGTIKHPADWTPAYGGIPNLPPYATDISTAVGTDREAEMRRNLPGYQAMTLADVANIRGNLAGRVAPDVIALLQQQAAERGIGTGTYGAPNTDAAYLRALGLTSLQLQQLGHTQLTEAMARTPYQERTTTTTQRDLGMERAQYAAAPDPAAAAAEAQRKVIEAIGAGKSDATKSSGGGSRRSASGIVGYIGPTGSPLYY